MGGLGALETTFCRVRPTHSSDAREIAPRHYYRNLVPVASADQLLRMTLVEPQEHFSRPG